MITFKRPLCLLVLLSLAFVLNACGSSGTSDPIASSSSSKAASSSSMSSSSSSESSVSSQSSSSSSSSSQPTHASNGTVYCTAAGTDPDGDGWGWENNATCLVRNSAADPDRGDFEGCIIDTGSWGFCATDNGSWGVEGGEICISESFCPANRSAEQTLMAQALVTPEPSAKAVAVFDYLQSIWGSKTLSGQQDLTWKDDTDMFQRVLDDTGKAPAIMGYDFMNYYRYSGGSGLKQVEEAIDHADLGGLITFCWHWRDPSRATQGFYTAETDFVIPISNGQLDTTSAAFVAIEKDVDDIAVELLRLQDANVPVLWRPLHEASGGWFWWGRPRMDDISPAYAQVVLWRYLYERLVNHHGLNNLIWVWNGQGAAWYPGDQYVDIVGEDIYDDPQSYDSQVAKFNQARAYSLQEKMVALTENSNIPDPDKMAEDGARWLWFVVWNDGNSEAGVTHSNNFWTGEYYNTDEHKVHVYNHPDVVTLDDLPDF